MNRELFCFCFSEIIEYIDAFQFTYTEIEKTNTVKKILIVFRSYHYSGSVVEWLRRMNENAPLLATGIFLPTSAFASVFRYAATANAAAETGYFPAVDKEEAGEIEKEMSMFEQDCIANGIECRLHAAPVGRGGRCRRIGAQLYLDRESGT